MLATLVFVDVIPEYADAFFLIRYHMNSVLESLKSMLLRLT